MRIAMRVVSLVGLMLLLVPPAGALGANATTRPAARIGPSGGPRPGQSTRPGAMTRPAASGLAGPAASQPASAPDPDSVAVIVNGQPIREKQIEAAIDEYVLRGRDATREELLRVRAQLSRQMGQLFDLVIGNELVAQDAKRAGKMLTDKQFEEEMRKRLDEEIKSRNMTPEQAAEQIKKQYNKSLDEFINQRSRMTAFRAQVLEERALAEKYADQLKVSDDELKSSYEQGKATRYTPKQEEVRASHILFGTKDPKTQAPMSEEVKKEQRQKAEKMLAEVKKPGADFAALAREYSSCPSGKAAGGDLGYFARGSMVKPFSDAAFALKVGDISGVVESDFGYHIIKLTGHVGAGETIPFNDVKDQIRKQLEPQKKQAAMMRYKEDLKKQAKIVYPPGKELATRPALAPPAMGLPPGHPRVSGTTTRPTGRITLPPQTKLQGTRPGGAPKGSSTK